MGEEKPGPTSSKTKMTALPTVYPPISHQEAIWLQDIPDVEDLLRRSDFYMIAARAEAKFVDLSLDENSHQLSFTFAIGDYFKDAVTLSLRELPAVAAHPEDGYWLEAGEKRVRLWDGPRRQGGLLCSGVVHNREADLRSLPAVAWNRRFRLWVSQIQIWLIRWKLHILRQFPPTAVLSALLASTLPAFRTRAALQAIILDDVVQACTGDDRYQHDGVY
jgi:hypothetical protein